MLGGEGLMYSILKGLAHSAQGCTAVPWPHGGATLGNPAAGAFNSERVVSNLCPSSIPHVSLIDGDIVAPHYRGCGRGRRMQPIQGSWC
jgi:hypothetical protein